MTVLFYVFAVVAARSESALGKYNGMCGGSSVKFNLNKSLLAAFFCLLIGLFSGGIEFHSRTLVYALFYGLLLAVSLVAGLKALSLGCMAITSTPLPILTLTKLQLANALVPIVVTLSGIEICVNERHP